MSPSKRSSSLILLSCLFLFSSAAFAHNITRILERDPSFSTFSELLSKTKLADEINKRKTITVLAVPNDQIGDLSSKPADVMKTILMNHIVLDYYDVLKLQKMKGKSTILTTLYQTTGVASYQQGFLNVTESKTGGIVFGSAVKGAPHDVTYLGSVASMPYNISVLSVSHPIIAPGIDGTPLRPFASPPKANAPLPPKAPAPAPEAEAPVADAPEADTPADAPADTPADAPADAPAEADATDDQRTESPTSGSARMQLGSSSVGMLVVLALFLIAY